MGQLSVSLTKAFLGRVSAIITQCAVSEPFNPPANPSKVVNCGALWDTGATNSVITKRLAGELNLKPLTQTKVRHAQGADFVNVYLVNIALENGVGFSFIRVTEGVLEGFDVLIGMDIITMGDYSITNVNNKTTFSFRIPSLKTIDYEAEAKHGKNHIPQNSIMSKFRAKNKKRK